MAKPRRRIRPISKPPRPRPAVLDIKDGVLDECYDHLKPKRMPRAVFDLRYLFMGKAYLLFLEKDLLRGLAIGGVYEA